MKKARNLVLLVLGALALLQFHSPRSRGPLTRIKARGNVRCGVSDGVPGFSFKEPDGRWSGMDVDFCVRWLPPSWEIPEGGIHLACCLREISLPEAGEIDVLARNTTWTLEREATLEVMFAGVLYYDGQASWFRPKTRRKTFPNERFHHLRVKGTTHERTWRTISVQGTGAVSP